MAILSSKEKVAWAVGTLLVGLVLWMSARWLFDRTPPVDVRDGWVVAAYDGKPAGKPKPGEKLQFRPGQGAFELIEVKWETQCYGNIVSVELVSPSGEVDGVKVSGTGIKLDDSVVSNPAPSNDYTDFKRAFQIPSSAEWHREGFAVFRVIVLVSHCDWRTPLWRVWPVRFARDFPFYVKP